MEEPGDESIPQERQDIPSEDKSEEQRQESESSESVSLEPELPALGKITLEKPAEQQGSVREYHHRRQRRKYRLL